MSDEGLSAPPPPYDSVVIEQVSNLVDEREQTKRNDDRRVTAYHSYDTTTQHKHNERNRREERGTEGEREDDRIHKHRNHHHHYGDKLTPLDLFVLFSFLFSLLLSSFLLSFRVEQGGMSAEAEGGVAAQGDTDASELSVKVYDPVKQGEGMSAYVSYRVEAKTNLPQYQQQVNEVIRRFKDFAWLKSKLEEKNPGVIGKTNTHTHT